MQIEILISQFTHSKVCALVMCSVHFWCVYLILQFLLTCIIMDLFVFLSAYSFVVLCCCDVAVCGL